MSYPVLYKATDTDIMNGKVPSNNGVGVLTNISEPVVTEERQGAFTLTFKYHAPNEYDDDYEIQKAIFESLQKRAVVKSKVNDFDGDRLFRIDEAELDTIGETKTITAIVIGQYDLAANAITKVDAKGVTPSKALQTMLDNAVVKNKFTAWSDISTTSNFSLDFKVVSEAIAGTEGSIIDTWRTDLEWDNFTIRLHKQRGQNKGVRIAFGKNLLGLTESTSGDVTTRIIPFAKIDDGAGGQLEITLPEVVIDADNVDDNEMALALPVDFSEDMQAKEYTTEAQLRTLAKDYFKKTGINVPKVNLDIDFVQLSKTEEYKDFAVLETVSLFDTVEIWHERYNKKIEAVVNKYEYDPVEELYLSLELGDAKYSLSDKAASDASNADKINDKIEGTYSFIQDAINKATDLITGNDGGYVVLYPPKRPAEIFIMDTDDVNTAKQVLRLNKSGIGFSSQGVNGPYETAWTLDGAFNANFITAGKITAVDIEGVNISGVTFKGKDMTLENNLVITGTNKGIAGNYDFGAIDSLEPRWYQGDYSLSARLLRFLATQWNLDANGNKINNSKTYVTAYYGPNIIKFRAFDQEGGNLLSRLDASADYLQLSKNWTNASAGSGVVLFSDGTIYGNSLENVSNINATTSIGINYARDGISADFNVGRDSNGARIWSSAIKNRTSGASPNVVITDAGTLARSTSGTKYKRNIIVKKVDAKKLLKIEPKTWFDKHLVSRLSRILKKEPTEKQLEHTYHREIGFIAEDLVDVGLEDFVVYSYKEDGSKEVEGIKYDRLTLPLLELAKEQHSKIEELEERMIKLEEAVFNGVSKTDTIPD